MLLPIKVRLILESWQYISWSISMFSHTATPITFWLCVERGRNYFKSLPETREYRSDNWVLSLFALQIRPKSHHFLPDEYLMRKHGRFIQLNNIIVILFSVAIHLFKSCPYIISSGGGGVGVGVGVGGGWGVGVGGVGGISLSPTNPINKVRMIIIFNYVYSKCTSHMESVLSESSQH